MKQPNKGVIKDPLPWRRFFDNKYLSSHDLTGDITVQIKEMRYEEVIGEKGRKDNCLIAVFTDEDLLPMIFNTTNSKIITKLYGTKIPLEWVGKKITIYVDHTVQSKAGKVVGGLRIRTVAPSDKLKTLNDGDFKRMIEAIKGGKFAIDKAKSSYAFTPTQTMKLTELENSLQHA